MKAPSPLARTDVAPLVALALPEGLVERAPTEALAPGGGGGGAGGAVVVVVGVVVGGDVTDGTTVLVVAGTVVPVVVVGFAFVVVVVAGTVVEGVVVVVVGAVVVVVVGDGLCGACAETSDRMATSPMAVPAAQHAAPVVHETPDRSPEESSAGTPTSLQVLPPSTVSATTAPVPYWSLEPTAKQSSLLGQEIPFKTPPLLLDTALGALWSDQLDPPSVVATIAPTSTWKPPRTVAPICPTAVQAVVVGQEMA